MTAAFTPNTKSRAPQVSGRDFFKELYSVSDLSNHLRLTERLHENICSNFININTPCESELIKTQDKIQVCIQKPLLSLEGSSLLLADKLKDTDTILDRFIPLRMKENLQAKFEAVSQNQTEFLNQKLPATMASNDLGQPST